MEATTSTAVAVVSAANGADGNQVESEPLGRLEIVRLPIAPLLAAAMCAKSAKREALEGVHLRAVGDDEIRIEGADGARAFLYSMPLAGAVAPEGEMPTWLGRAEGLTLPLDGLAERLKIIEKEGSEIAIVGYQLNAAHVMLSDPGEHAVFRILAKEESAFPDLQAHVVDRLNFGGRRTGDLESISYDPAQFKGVGDIAKVLEAQQVRMFGTGNPKGGDPTLFTFPGCAGAVLVMMPVAPPTQIEQSTMRILGGAVGGTLAALRAHRTRWVQKLDEAPNERAKKTIETKIAGYDERINAILAQTMPALPAPAGAEEETVEFGPGEGEAPAAEEPAEAKGEVADLRAYRKKLKGAAAGKVWTRFVADVNAALSALASGLTVHQLADGVPLTEWYQIGLTPEQAAQRCLDWQEKQPKNARDPD